MSVTVLTQTGVAKPAESAFPAAISMPPRNVALVASRGLVMLLIMAR